MKAIRIEFPADMPVAAIQGLLREHRLKLNILGGSDKHKDYRAERTDARLSAPVFDYVERN